MDAIERLDALLAQRLPTPVKVELRRKRDAAQDADDPVAYLREYADAYRTPDVTDPTTRCAGTALAAAVATDENERADLEIATLKLAARALKAMGEDVGDVTYTVTAADGTTYTISGAEAMRFLDR